MFNDSFALSAEMFLLYVQQWASFCHYFVQQHVCYVNVQSHFDIRAETFMHPYLYDDRESVI